MCNELKGGLCIEQRMQKTMEIATYFLSPFIQMDYEEHISVNDNNLKNDEPYSLCSFWMGVINPTDRVFLRTDEGFFNAGT